MMTSIKKLSFEEAISELDIIIEKINNDNIPIDDMESLFEKALVLNHHCKSILEKTKGKISKLVKENDEFKLLDID